MALVKGTNCGFVTAAPTGDPAESASTVDNAAQALKDTAPVGAEKVTEIGWYCGNATQEANFEVGIYEHNAGDDNPEALVAKEATNAKGTGIGWKKATSLNIAITAGQVYWLAVQLDNTATATMLDSKVDGGQKIDVKGSQVTLTDPWGVSGATYGQLISVYAVYESQAAQSEENFAALKDDTIGDNDSPGIF